MPGFLVYLNFYGQILTEVYKLNFIEAKEMNWNFWRITPTVLACSHLRFGSPEFLPEKFRYDTC